MTPFVHVVRGTIAPWRLWRALLPARADGFILGPGRQLAGHGSTWVSASPPSNVWTSAAGDAGRLLSRFGGPGRTADAAPRRVGWFGFSCGRSFDPGLARLPRPSAAPRTAAWLADFPDVVEIDHEAGVCRLIVRSSGSRFAVLRRRFEQAVMAGGVAPGPARGRLRDVPSEAVFTRMAAEAKRRITAGDIYQANLSLPFRFDFNGDPLALYAALSDLNPSPYACAIRSGSSWVVSCSPELLVKTRGRSVFTRPIAGTRPRDPAGRGDRRRAGRLLLSPKERAEHVMLVDLERNDLGRVARPASVRVSERFSVERYSHVMHIVSEVRAELARGRTPADAFAAVFPGGTITGCPKIEAVRVIEGLERVDRGVFYGSAGFSAPNGDITFNILIRTAFITGRRAVVRAGAGIVADSRAPREYREIRRKAEALVRAFQSLGG